MTDDPFDAIVAGLDLEPEPTDIESVRDLDTKTLLERFSRVKQELLHADGLGTTTAEGRDLHSELSAYKVELARRDLS